MLKKSACAFFVSLLLLSVTTAQCADKGEAPGAKHKETAPRSEGELKAVQKRALKKLALNANDAAALIELGKVEIELEQLEQGLEHINKGININPARADAYSYDLERTAYTALGQLKPALASATKAVELAPVDWRFKERGEIFVALHQNDDALKDFSKAIELAPRQLWNFMDRAKVYSSTGQYEKALADYTSATKISPSNPLPYRCRAEVYKKLGKKDLAAQDSKTATKLDGF